MPRTSAFPFPMIRQWLAAPFAYRSLLGDFLRQEIAGRYAGSFGGLAWMVITPLAQIAVYLFVFSTIMRVSVDRLEAGTDRFAIYLLTGLLPWLAFSESVSRAPSLLVEKAQLITKVAFPVEILPTVGTLVAFVLNGVGFAILLVGLAFQGYAHPAWICVLWIATCQLLFTVGMVAILAALGVFVRDIQPIMGTVVFVWFFLTPIVYPFSMLPSALRPWMIVNPMYVFVELYREILLLHRVTPALHLWVTAISVAMFLGGGWIFLRMKPAFADVL